MLAEFQKRLDDETMNGINATIIEYNMPDDSELGDGGNSPDGTSPKPEKTHDYSGRHSRSAKHRLSPGI